MTFDFVDLSSIEVNDLSFTGVNGLSIVDVNDLSLIFSFVNDLSFLINRWSKTMTTRKLIPY